MTRCKDNIFYLVNKNNVSFYSDNLSNLGKKKSNEFFWRNKMDWNEINNLYNTDDDEMYDNAILIFDTSSLLELYFYSTESAIEILEKCILHFQDRLFLPNHVKFEFDKNREVIIEKQTLGYQNVFNKKNSIGFFAKIISQQDAIKKIKKDTNNFFKSFEQQFGNTQTHPYFSNQFINDFKEEVEKFSLILDSIETNTNFSDYEARLTDEKDERISIINQQITNDKIKEIIETDFKIGNGYSFDKLMDIISEGKIRYAAEIPPGYMDEKDKKSIQIYGDLIIWKQILEYARSQNKPVIFVSDDTKEDWNEIIEGQEPSKVKKDTDPKRPRYEILLEFNDIVGQKLRKVRLSDFLYELNEQLETKFGSSTIGEIKIRSLREEIEADAPYFIEAFESVIEDEQRDGTVPDEAVEQDENENWAELNQIDEISIEMQSDNSYLITYLATFDCYVEFDYYKYWGRDDDTKELVTSPPNTITASGELLVRVLREVEVDFDQNFYPNITETKEPSMEIIEDNRDYETVSWEEREGSKFF